jgi:hypothetical protein
MTYNLNQPNNHGLSYPHLLTCTKDKHEITLMTTPDALPMEGDVMIMATYKVTIKQILDMRPGKGKHKVENPIWVKAKMEVIYETN